MEFQIIRILSATHTISKKQLQKIFQKPKAKKKKPILFLCLENLREPELISNGISLLVVEM